MTTEIAIANSGIAAQAFVYMEMSPISSFVDETRQAQDARTAYPQALLMMLESADWSFASVRRDLLEAEMPAGVGSDPTMPHFYVKPTDCLILREVGDMHTRWENMRGHLRADVPNVLNVRYTGQISDEGQMPAQFRNCVALQLAVLLSGTYVPTQSKRDYLAQMLQQAASLALQSDARNASPRAWHDHDNGQHRDWVREATL